LDGHLRIGRGARIAAQAGVIWDVPSGGEVVVGYPAQPKRVFFRQVAILKRMARRQK
jgi:UDP-3-O-[3-hydroxymyristoyl] glucosamine N-acyltransferase